MTGLAANLVLGRRARDVFPEAMAAGIEENLRRVIETGRPQSREFEYTVPQTGRGGWSLNTARPHRDASGQIIGVIASVRDITARHEARGRTPIGGAVPHHLRQHGRWRGDLRAWRQLPRGQPCRCEVSAIPRELLAMPVGAINSPESAATIPERVQVMIRGGPRPRHRGDACSTRRNRDPHRGRVPVA